MWRSPAPAVAAGVAAFLAARQIARRQAFLRVGALLAVALALADHRWRRR